LGNHEVNAHSRALKAICKDKLTAGAAVQCAQTLAALRAAERSSLRNCKRCPSIESSFITASNGVTHNRRLAKRHFSHYLTATRCPR